MFFFDFETTHKNSSKRDSYQADSAFVEYQKFIATHPAYAGMPDLYFDDGSIQWEAPSNRKSGQFKDSHDKRLKWWKEKAKELGIRTTENQWISKTAKALHPTKLRPCKKCGRVMDIRYIYLSTNLLKRLAKLGYTDLPITYTTSIFEFLEAASKSQSHGSHLLRDLPSILRCAQFQSIPSFTKLEDAKKWIATVYVPAEPSTLSPGAMSNAPDRLDGFHSFNRCCRSTADKGRSKENLASYATDRRAFEFWSDGNWITANKLMGLIRTDPTLSSLECHCRGDGKDHPKPCSADHIGPISLGFCHRPVFQLLCQPCNSAKNNRMFLSDVRYLLECEKRGDNVISWYARGVWNALKGKVKTQDDATRLSRVMRDNRFNAMIVLGQFMTTLGYLFLYHLLDLSYGDYSYSPSKIKVDGDYVIATFTQCKCETLYGIEQKSRKVRVAFESLREYLEKSQRNGACCFDDYDKRAMQSIKADARNFALSHKDAAKALADVIDARSISEESLRNCICNMPTLHSDKYLRSAKNGIAKLMDRIGSRLADNWTSDRYCRDLSYDQEFLF